MRPLFAVFARAKKRRARGEQIWDRRLHAPLRRPPEVWGRWEGSRIGGNLPGDTVEDGVLNGDLLITRCIYVPATKAMNRKRLAATPLFVG
ncbi:hypothetical protein MRX96_019785 [Rhipicephalus microplus]